MSEHLKTSWFDVSVSEKGMPTDLIAGSGFPRSLVRDEVIAVVAHYTPENDQARNLQELNPIRGSVRVSEIRATHLSRATIHPSELTRGSSSSRRTDHPGSRPHRSNALEHPEG